MSRNCQKLPCTGTRIAQPPKQVHRSMGHMKDNEQGFLFCKRVFIDSSLVKALEAVEAGQKSQFFKYNTQTVGFYLILTYIWYISLCKILQLQESEMRPTGWTLSYPIVRKSLLSVSIYRQIYFILFKRKYHHRKW